MLHPFLRAGYARALLFVATCFSVGAISPRAAFAQEEVSRDPEAARATSTARQQTSAVPTEVVVRAIAQDAKVIQSSVGGARVTIRNAQTGEVLASGAQEGGSGSTEKIMREPHARGASPYDTEDAARFTTTLALSEPTRVEVSAEGPLDYPQAMQRARATLLLVPGQHIRGEGIVLRSRRPRLPAREREEAVGEHHSATWRSGALSGETAIWKQRLQRSLPSSAPLKDFFGRVYGTTAQIPSGLSRAGSSTQ